eukprot:1549149-Prymnesium_polylepis.2
MWTPFWAGVVSVEMCVLGALLCFSRPVILRRELRIASWKRDGDIRRRCGKEVGRGARRVGESEHTTVMGTAVGRSTSAAGPPGARRRRRAPGADARCGQGGVGDVGAHVG